MMPSLIIGPHWLRTKVLQSLLQLHICHALWLTGVSVPLVEDYSSPPPRRMEVNGLVNSKMPMKVGSGGSRVDFVTLHST